MSSFHGQTRPDPPRIPQDLATKGYVDDASTHDHISQVGIGLVDAAPTGAVEYCCIFGRTGLATQENQRQFSMAVNCTLSDLLVVIRTNTLDEEAIITMQVNTPDGNETVTVPAATTGDFSDLVNTDDFVFGESQGYKIDNSATTSGASSITSISNRCLVT